MRADRKYQGRGLNEQAIARNYSVFNPQGNHIFPLSKAEAKKVKHIFSEIREALNSEYAYRKGMGESEKLLRLHPLLCQLRQERLIIKAFAG